MLEEFVNTEYQNRSITDLQLRFLIRFCLAPPYTLVHTECFLLKIPKRPRRLIQRRLPLFPSKAMNNKLLIPLCVLFVTSIMPFTSAFSEEQNRHKYNASYERSEQYNSFWDESNWLHACGASLLVITFI